MSHEFALVRDLFYTGSIENWNAEIAPEMGQKVMQALESGKILYLPNLSFQLEKDEPALLKISFHNQKTKNISYNPLRHQVTGLTHSEVAENVSQMLQRFERLSTQLMASLCSQYRVQDHLGRTSFLTCRN